MKNEKSKILSKIKKSINEIDSSADTTLFGSQARNEERPDSDWDILILTDAPTSLKNEQLFRHQLFEIEIEFGIALSTFVYSKSDWKNKYSVTELYQNIAQEGIRI